MAFEPRFNLYSLRFVSGPEALTLTDSVRVYVFPMEVASPFCVSGLPDILEEDLGGGDADGEGEHENTRLANEDSWSDVPYHPSGQQAALDADDSGWKHPFHSGDQLCVLADEEFSSISVVLSWWIRWNDFAISCRNPFEAEGEAYGPDDPIFSIYGVSDLAKKRGLNPEDFVLKYVEYLFARHCIAREAFSKCREK